MIIKILGKLIFNIQPSGLLTGIHVPKFWINITLHFKAFPSSEVVVFCPFHPDKKSILQQLSLHPMG
jgi:hypothetical protein